MKLSTFLVASVAAYALLHFLVIPESDRRWAANGTLTKAGKIGTLAALRSLRSVLQVAIVTYAALYVLLLALTAVGIGTVPAARYLAVLERSQQLKDAISGWREHWGVIEFWLAVLGIAYFSYRHNCRDARRSLQAVVDREMQRLCREHELGKWEALAPDAAMTEIAQGIAATLAQTERIEAAIASGGLDSSTAEAATRALEHARSSQERLQRLYLQHDLARRMNLTTQPEDSQPGVRRLWPTVFRFLTSKGLSGDMGRVAKGASWAGTALMFVGLVAVNAPVIAADVASRVVQLSDLAVAANHDEAVARWRALPGRHAAPESTLLEPSPQALQLSRAFTAAYLASLRPRIEGIPEAKAFELRAYAVRHRLLSQAGQEGDCNVRLAEPRVQEPTGRDSQGLVSLLDRYSDKDVYTRLERWVARRLESTVRQQPEAVWNRITEKLAAHFSDYGRPLEPSDLASSLLGELLTPVLDASTPEIEDEYLRQASKSLKKALSAAAEKSIETAYHRFLFDLVGDTTLGQAIAHVESQRGPWTTITQPLLDQISSVLEVERDAVSSLKLPQLSLELKNHDPIDLPTATKWYKKWVSTIQASGNWDRRYADGLALSVASYEDLFAGSSSALAATPRSRILAEAGISATSNDVQSIVRRSRNFEMLDKFYKTGGIVIGRSAEAPTSGSLVMGLAWQKSGAGRLAISLQDSNRVWRELGSFPEDTVRTALLYAADGRMLTVTIVNTEVDGAQKVLLHPALVDTSVGCTLVELDQFVFHFINPAVRDSIAARTTADRDIDLLFRLSGYAAANPQQEDPSQLSAFLGRWTARLGVRLELGLRAFKARAPGSGGVLAANVYDKGIVDIMRRCTDHDDVPGFLRCVNERGSTERVHWTGYTPAMQPISAVREQRFHADKALHFVDGVGTLGLWPFEFFVQETFGSAVGEVLPAVRLDEFDNAIRQAVDELVANDRVAARIVEDARSFVILQRLFRMALSGDLGRGFPVELLSRLHAAVSTRAASAATPRWLVFRKPMTEVDGLVAALHLPIATGEATKPRGCR